MGRRWTIVWFALFFLFSFSATAFATVNRISGNGYIFPETLTYKAIFSMDVSKDGANPPSGLVKYYYSRTRMSMVSTAITNLTSTGVGTSADISGNCTVNNIAGYTFSATVTNGRPDSFRISIYKSDGSRYYSAGPKNLSGGDLVLTDIIPPTIAITSPPDLLTLGSSPIRVSGTIDDPTSTLTVNGSPVTGSNGTFSADGITLNEGMNTIIARATDPANNISTASINISLDSTPPHVSITSPPEGYVTTASPITVTGIINDIVRGTVNENQGRVLVNGIEAVVDNRTFIVENLPLNPGANTLRAVGSDQVGNVATASVTVNLDLSAQARINLYSGDNQRGFIGTPISEPFVVYLNNENGAPVSGRTVTFRVIESNGSLDGGERAIAVTSSSNGLASANFTLGTWSGSGNNKVEAKAVGFTGSVIFTASGIRKPPAAIYVQTS
ncbi:MAG: hypothetical protein HZA08_08390 [Nitrospirae bacterium]|nr:hypothetical protein [Nitrospirota bacterium]